MSTGEDSVPGPSSREPFTPVSSAVATAAPHTGTQRLAPEDVQLIARAVADILRSPPTASPLTSPPSHVPSLSVEGTMDAHEGIYPYEYIHHKLLAMTYHGLHQPTQIHSYVLRISKIVPVNQ